MQNCWRLHHVTISWWIDSNFSNYISKWFYQSFLYNMNSLLLPNMNLPTNSNEYQLHWINFLQIYQNCKRNARTSHQTLNELEENDTIRNLKKKSSSPSYSMRYQLNWRLENVDAMQWMSTDESTATTTTTLGWNQTRNDYTLQHPFFWSFS